MLSKFSLLTKSLLVSSLLSCKTCLPHSATTTSLLPHYRQAAFFSRYRSALPSAATKTIPTGIAAAKSTSDNTNKSKAASNKPARKPSLMLSSSQVKETLSTRLQRALGDVSFEIVSDAFIKKHVRPGDKALLKTMIFETKQKEVIMVLVPKHYAVDPNKLTEHVGRKAALIYPEKLERVSGQKLGTIGPIACKTTPYAIIIDEAAMQGGLMLDKHKVYVGCGVRGYHLALNLQDLLKLTAARVIKVSTPPVESLANEFVDKDFAYNSNQSTSGKEESKEDILPKVESLAVSVTTPTLPSVVATKATNEVVVEATQEKGKKKKEKKEKKEKPATENKKNPDSDKKKSKVESKAETPVVETAADEVVFSSSKLRNTVNGKDVEELAKLLEAAKARKFHSEFKVSKKQTVADLLNVGTEKSGKTALHIAAWKAPIEMVKLLLDHGAEIDQYSTNSGNYGKSAIFYAITQYRDEVVQLLLERGASVLMVNNKGQTPRSLAVSHLQVETIMAIDQAEIKQLAKGKQWQNFYKVNVADANEVFGDLDPRFVPLDLVQQILNSNKRSRNSYIIDVDAAEATDDRQLPFALIKSTPQDTTIPLNTVVAEDPTATAELPRSILPTTVESRRLRYQIIASKQLESFQFDLRSTVYSIAKNKEIRALMENEQALLSLQDKYVTIQPSIINNISTASDEGTNNNTEAVGKKVKMKAYVLSKRKTSPAMAFVSIAPISTLVPLLSSMRKRKSSPRNPEYDYSPEEIQFATFLASRYGWKLDYDPSLAEHIDLNKLNNDGSYSMALVLGHDLRNYLGGLGMNNLLKNLNIGDIVEIEGDIESIGEGKPPLSSLQSFDFKEVQGEDLSIGNMLYDVQVNVKRCFIVETTNKWTEELPQPVVPPKEDNSNLPAISLDDITYWKSLEGAQPTPSSSRRSNHVFLVNDQHSTAHFEVVAKHILEQSQNIGEASAYTTSSTSLDNVVALDCEWKPSYLRKKDDNVELESVEEEQPVELLQLSTRYGVFLFDFPKLIADKSPSIPLLQEIFASENILKLGFHIGTDLQRIAVALTNHSSDATPSNNHHLFKSTLDIQVLSRVLEYHRIPKMTSLESICKTILRKRLDKSQQCSPWHERPWDEEQLQYAALDAAILMKLFDYHLKDIVRRVYIKREEDHHWHVSSVFNYLQVSSQLHPRGSNIQNDF